VTYTVYSNNSCTQGARDAGTVTVTNGGVPDSNALTFDSAGTFYWQAVYSGDANNNPATSLCTSETLIVNKLTPTNSTAQNLIPNDNFTLSGGFNPTGTITFNLYAQRCHLLRYAGADPNGQRRRQRHVRDNQHHLHRHDRRNLALGVELHRRRQQRADQLVLRHRTIHHPQPLTGDATGTDRPAGRPPARLTRHQPARYAVEVSVPTFSVAYEATDRVAPGPHTSMALVTNVSVVTVST
jgi:hypothetical protein